MDVTSDVQAAILAGGAGSRLRSVVSDRPKVLAEVGGRPFVVYLLEQLSVSGISRAVLCTGYMAEKVRELLGDTYGPLELLYSREDEPLGTGGALRLALPLLSADTVLVMNGDSYMDVDLCAFVEWFFRAERQAALVLTKVGDTARYGTVAFDEEQRITAFEEKGTRSGAGWINAGVYVMRKSVIASIAPGRLCSLERELFPSLAGEKLFAFCADGRFIDIGTPESYAAAADVLAVKRWESIGKSGRAIQ
jgi:NDP-sugar pyrophosphorylase family protein